MQRITRISVAVALVVTACGGSAATTTTASSPTTSTTSTTVATTTTPSTSATTLPPATTTTYAEGTTVTTYPSAFASPLNGLPADLELDLDRRAIGVKIDNHFRARPQSGVMDADLIVETRVEAGLTRFIAFFHDNDSEYVGPIRSVRPTDSTIAAAIGAPLTISGGQSWIQAIVAGRGVGLIGPGAGKLFRISSRLAPHNLYGNTVDMRAGADSQGYADTPPRPLYDIGEWDYPADDAESITMDWSDAVTVTWDYVDGRYERTQDGVAHESITASGDRTRITAEVLVVLGGEFYTVFPPTSGSAIPAIDTAGSGPAWVFARGRVWQGTWQRSQYEDRFQLVSSDGSAATVPSGFAWVSVFPEHRAVTWQ